MAPDGSYFKKTNTTKPAAFSSAVLCIIVFRLSSLFGALGLFRSDMLLISHMVWL